MQAVAVIRVMLVALILCLQVGLSRENAKDGIQSQENEYLERYEGHESSSLNDQMLPKNFFPDRESQPKNRISVVFPHKWFHSNDIPTSKDDSLSVKQTVKQSDVESDFLHNIFVPVTEKITVNPINFLRNPSLYPSTDISTVHRRHAKKGKGLKEQKRQRQLERERKREERKNKKMKAKAKKKISNPRVRKYLKEETIQFHDIDGTDFLDCCPSKLAVVKKVIGKDRDNHAVEVHPTQYYFYERVCLEEIENQECLFASKFVSKKITSICVQQFSYVQKQIRPYQNNSDWKLDYVQIKSGCSCQVSVIPKKKKKKKSNKN